MRREVVERAGATPEDGKCADNAAEAAGTAEVTVDLSGTPDEVASAAIAVAERLGGSVGGVEAFTPAGSGYRITTRLAAQDDLGPMLLVFELAGVVGVEGAADRITGRGALTRVRIVQSGFGTQAEWDDLFASERERDTSTACLSGHPRRRGGLSGRPRSLPPLPPEPEPAPPGWPPQAPGTRLPSSGGLWPDRLPAPDLDLDALHPNRRWPASTVERPMSERQDGRERHAPRPSARPDLVAALERACVQLLEHCRAVAAAAASERP